MFAVLRVQKLKTAGNIGSLNSHLTRTMDVPNADKSKSHLNQLLVGSNDLNSDVQNRITEAKSKVRKDSVLALEFLLTASPEYFKGNTSQKVSDFKNAASGWLVENYGLKNLVNVRLHMDERTPHMHAIVVPIDDKGKLNAKLLLGNRDKMRSMQTSFAKAVEPLGLERGVTGSKAEHVRISEYYELLNKANEVRSVDPPIYEIKKPSITEGTFLAEQWTREQNENIRRSAENLKVKLKDDTVKTNLERVKQFLDAKAGEAFKKAEKALRNEFKTEKEALMNGFEKVKQGLSGQYTELVGKWNNLVDRFNIMSEEKIRLEVKLEKYEPKKPEIKKDLDEPSRGFKR